MEMGDDWFVNIGSSFINPEPVVSKETEGLVNDFLSSAKLKEISGKDDLDNVESIEMVVNTSETSLGNFGQYLPKLTQLKLNDSCVPSIRDIGTSFDCLTVLWMSRCRVDEVDGIASMQALQELYIAYNNISDLSPITFLENLEVLDLEGNKVSDVDQIDYLKILSNLTMLTLTGNPVCLTFHSKSKKSFREFVLKALPHLQLFDDISAKVLKLDDVSNIHSQEDIDIITNAIKEGVDIETNLRSASPESSTSIREPEEAASSSNLLPQTFSLSPLKRLTTMRPVTAATTTRRRQVLFEDPVSTSRISPRPASSGSDNSLLASDDLSTLTIGDPLCGNPLQALKQRKKGPMLAFGYLSNDVENLNLQATRPKTSIGFRQSSARSSSQRNSNSLANNVSGLDEPVKRLSLSDIPCSSTDSSSSSNQLKEFKNLAKSNGLHSMKSPSPPLSKQSPSKPFKSPTPPQSPQRPGSTQEFQTSRRRRTFSSGASQSLNIMSVNSVEKPCRTPNSIQSKENQTT